VRKIVLGFIAMSLVGCGGATVQVNPNAKFPLPVTDDAPAFLFPINMSHLGAKGDPLAMGLAVSGGVIGQYGKKVISGQQLFDLVGNLSFELAEQMRGQVQAKMFDMSGGAEPTAKMLADLMNKILEKLTELGLLPAGYKFKYIICLHSHGSAGMAPNTLNVESWGGIYESESKTILSYIESKDTYVDDDKAILGQIPLAYNKIIDQLLQGNAPEKK
jgi:hypothetical protein